MFAKPAIPISRNPIIGVGYQRERVSCVVGCDEYGYGYVIGVVIDNQICALVDRAMTVGPQRVLAVFTCH